MDFLPTSVSDFDECENFLLRDGDGVADGDLLNSLELVRMSMVGIPNLLSLNDGLSYGFMSLDFDPEFPILGPWNSFTSSFGSGMTGETGDARYILALVCVLFEKPEGFAVSL